MKIILLILLVGCGLREDEIKEYRVDSEFSDYVNEFYRVHNSESSFIHQDNLIVEFSDSVTGSTLGVCIRSSNTHIKLFKREIQKTPIVQINPTWWFGFDSDENREQKAAVIDHELGHCLLNRGHVESSYIERVSEVNGVEMIVKPSVMYPYIPSQTEFHHHYQFYQSELHGLSNFTTHFDRSIAYKTIEDDVEYSHVVNTTGILGVTPCVHQFKSKEESQD